VRERARATVAGLAERGIAGAAGPDRSAPATPVSAAISGSGATARPASSWTPAGQGGLRPFVAIAQALRGLGLNAPEVLAAIRPGLLLLTISVPAISGRTRPAQRSSLYGDALEALARLQSAAILAHRCCRLRFGVAAREMELFASGSWAAARPEPARGEHHALDHAFALLADNALEQRGSGCIAITIPAPDGHRSDNPGVLDFRTPWWAR